MPPSGNGDLLRGTPGRLSWRDASLATGSQGSSLQAGTGLTSVTHIRPTFAPAASAQAHAADAGGDQLAAAVLRSLGRSHRNHLSLSPVRAGVLALLTFGVAPLLKLTRQFRNFVTLEHQQFWHLSEWVRTRTGSDEARELAEATRRIRFREGLVAWINTTLVMVGLIVFVVIQDRFSLSTLIDGTYRYRGLWPGFYAERLAIVFAAWNVGIGLAYALHWLQVRLHGRDVARFAEAFNRVARREGVEELRPWRLDAGLDFGWIMAAVLLCAAGAWWSIPMALAGAGQREYINVAGQHLRTGLVERVSTMLLLRRPPVPVPAITIAGQRCPNDLCKAPLRAAAAFCARCGARSSAISAVA